MNHNKMFPFFSIVIPSLNQGVFLEKALISMFSQSDQDFEVILVDGGSSDSSLDVIKKYKNRFSWWVSEPDTGQSNALNKGFSKARGRYLTWLNADDILLPDTLRNIKRYVGQYAEQHPLKRCDWIVGNLIYIDTKGDVLWCAKDGRWHPWLYQHAPVRVYGPSSFFTRELFLQSTGLDESLHYVMDTDLWLQFKNLGFFYQKVDHYCWAFRVHGESKTSEYVKGKKPSESIKHERQYIYRKHGLNVTKTGLMLQRGSRLLNGSYLASGYDTMRYKGRCIDDLFQTPEGI